MTRFADDYEAGRKKEAETAAWQAFLAKAREAGFDEKQARFMYEFLALKHHRHFEWRA